MQIPQGISSPLLEAQADEFMHRQLFQWTSKIALGGIFTILLLNTFFFYQFKSKNQALQSSMMVSRHQLAELDSLKSQVEHQERLFQQTQVHQNTRTAYYADRIATTLPVGLQLSELTIFPMKGKKRDYDKEELIQYENDRITIKGKCENSLIYNQWIKQLQELKWISAARHVDYKDVNNALGEFELHLTLSPSI